MLFKKGGGYIRGTLAEDKTNAAGAWQNIIQFCCHFACIKDSERIKNQEMTTQYICVYVK